MPDQVTQIDEGALFIQWINRMAVAVSENEVSVELVLQLLACINDLRLLFTLKRFIATLFR